MLEFITDVFIFVDLYLYNLQYYIKFSEHRSLSVKELLENAYIVCVMFYSISTLVPGMFMYIMMLNKH